MKDSNSVPLHSRSSYDQRGNGVVYTPVAVTEVVVSQALAKLDYANASNVLEPSCGDGSFVGTLASKTSLNIYALDKNEAAIHQCRSAFDGVQFHCGDFFEDLPGDWPNHFDLIVGNPPYVSWHRCSSNTRSLLDRIGSQFDFDNKELRNTWAGFVVKATMMLSPKGVLAFVIPYEFLNVSYGKYLREWMERHFSSIDIFIPNEKAFKSIDQDAVTIVASKGEGSCETVLHRVASLDTNSIQSSCKLSPGIAKSRPLEMKGFLLDGDVLNLIHKIDQRCKRISDYCENAAGTVTAANDYFILSKAELKSRKLTRWGRPIIKKSAFLGDTVNFTARDFDAIEASGKACRVLDFSKLRSDRLPKAVQKYVELGEELGVNQRYKCRHRQDWFKVPIVQDNEGLFFKRSHIVPRLCVNSCGVLATDSAYHLRMNSSTKIQDLCGSFYNSLTLLFAEIEGRFYGGGVLELTPNEFRRLPLSMSDFSEPEFAEFESRFTLSDGGSKAIEFSNIGLKRNLRLSTAELQVIEDARQTLQRHRLRHGGITQK